MIVVIDSTYWLLVVIGQVNSDHIWQGLHLTVLGEFRCKFICLGTVGIDVKVQTLGGICSYQFGPVWDAERKPSKNAVRDWQVFEVIGQVNSDHIGQGLHLTVMIKKWLKYFNNQYHELRRNYCELCNERL